MSDPFVIQSNALISFSGGRTSAYMLWRVLQANDGELSPLTQRVVFANTGKERPETLRFVQDVAAFWDVSITWIEAAPGGYKRVTPQTASRNGEPFADLIARKKFAPNALARFCTEELKVKPLLAFAKDAFGGHAYTEMIGLRADEPWRVAKMLDRNASTGRNCIAPLARAGIRKEDVLAFWRAQDFDLDLPPGGAGNCDLCYLKSRRTLERLIAEDPTRADWWIAQEAAAGGRFVTEYSYAELKASARAQPDLFDDEHDAECGLLCEPVEPSQ